LDPVQYHPRMNTSDSWLLLYVWLSFIQSLSVLRHTMSSNSFLQCMISTEILDNIRHFVTLVLSCYLEEINY